MGFIWHFLCDLRLFNSPIRAAESMKTGNMAEKKTNIYQTSLDRRAAGSSTAHVLINLICFVIVV